MRLHRQNGFMVRALASVALFGALVGVLLVPSTTLASASFDSRFERSTGSILGAFESAALNVFCAISSVFSDACAFPAPVTDLGPAFQDDVPPPAVTLVVDPTQPDGTAIFVEGDTYINREYVTNETDYDYIEARISALRSEMLALIVTTGGTVVDENPVSGFSSDDFVTREQMRRQIESALDSMDDDDDDDDNGGGGTGGDADDSELLDGVDSTQFLRSDENDTFDGDELTIGAGSTLVVDGAVEMAGDTITDFTGFGLEILNGELSVATSSLGIVGTTQWDNVSGGINYASGNVGIGTSTPWKKLSVGGDMALTGGFFDAYSSAGTSGYVLQSTGTSTRWVATSTLGFASGAAVTSLNGQTDATQTFATSSDTNLRLTITSTGGVHTFTPAWSGTLDGTRGGTGLGTVTANQLLIGGAGNTWTQVATSSLGLLTTNVAEGSNLYFTPARADARVAAGTTTIRGMFSATSPLAYDSGTGIFSATNAAADGTTKGVSAFTAADFDASSGVIAIDYANGQAASGSTKGFLTAADWTTFNNKLSSLTGTTGQVAYFSGANMAAGTSSLFIATNSNIGIGTTSPYAKLSVDGSIALTGGIYDNNATRGTNGMVLQTTGSGVAWVATSSLGISGGASLTGTAGQVPYFSGTDTVVGTSSIFVSSAGKVGVGTVSPSAQLDVATPAGTPGSPFRVVAGLYSRTAISVSEAGQVDFPNGIEMNGQNISLYGSGGSFVNSSNLVFNNTQIQDSSGDFRFGNRGLSSEYMRIMSTGNIGIGTTSPYAKLSVDGSIALTGGIYDNNSTRGTSGMVLQTNGSGIAWVATSSLGITGGGGGSYDQDLNTSDDVSFNGFSVTGTATSTFAGNIGISGSIIPSADITYDLGSPEKQWRDVYIGPGSLYINGQKVLEEDSDNIVVTADTNQSLIMKTSGTGDLELNPTGSGQVLLKGNVRVSAGYHIDSSDGSPVDFADGVRADNVSILDNTIQANNLNGGVALAATGTGAVYVTVGNFGIGTTSPLAKTDVYGNMILSGPSRYLNFGDTSGSLGYGLRDNAGTIEFKNSAGSWAGIGGGGSSLTGTTGQIAYFSGTDTAVGTSSLFVAANGYVGIGTTTPGAALDINGGIAFSDANSIKLHAYNGDVDFLEYDSGGGIHIRGYGPSLTLDNGAGGVNTRYALISSGGILWDSSGTSLVANTGYAGKVAIQDVLTVVGGGNVGIGTAAPNYPLEVFGTASSTALSIPQTTSSGIGVLNMAGTRYLHSYGATNNTFVGSGSGVVTGSGMAGNTGIGAATLDALTSGDFNTAVGNLALSAVSAAAHNTAVGNSALQVNVLGTGNTALGSGALDSLNGGTADYNIGIGYAAGNNLVTGQRNIIIGYDIDATSTTMTRGLNIGNLIFGTGLDGTGTTLANGSIGIGTTSPYAKLAVAGDIAVTGGIYDNNATRGTSGMLLQTTGSGVQWVATSSLGISGGASLTGSAGQIAYFSGTDTAVGTSTLFISSTSRIGVGTAVPLYRLQVQGSNNGVVRGQVSITDGNAGDGAAGREIVISSPYDSELIGRIQVLGTAADLRLGTRDSADLLNIANSGNVGIGLGTAAPNFKLEVNGTASATAFNIPTTASAAVGTINMGGSRFIHGFGTANTFMGGNSGNFTLSGGTYNSGFGNGTLSSLTSGHSNVAIGASSLNALAAGARNVAIGYASQDQTTTGSDNVGIGYVTMRAVSGGENVAIGNSALSALTSGARNVGIGGAAGDNLTTGSDNIIIGDNIDAVAVGSNNTLNIGNLIFGTGLDGLGTTLATGNVGIGTTTPAAKFAVNGASYLSGTTTFAAGLTSPGSGTLSEQFGSGAIAPANGTRNVVVGNAATISSGSSYAVVVGQSAVAGGSTAVSIGYAANSTGTSVAIGEQTVVAGGFSIALGRQANVSGASSVGLGHSTGVSGSQSIAIGKDATANFNNSGAIGFGAVATAANQLVLGGSGAGATGYNDIYVGNGVTNTSAYATTTTINVTGASGSNVAGVNLVLAGGKGTGTALGGSLVFSTSDVTSSGATLQTLSEKMRISPLGNVGIGTTSPYAKLSVVGEVVARNFTATSTTATSTFAGGLSVGGGALTHDFATGLTSIGNLAIGATTFQADSGMLSWIDMPVTAASASGVVQSYSAQLDGNPIFTVYGESDGSGGTQNRRLGVGTTTPWQTFSVQGTVAFAGLSTDATVGLAGALCLDANNQLVKMSGSGTCVTSSARYKTNDQDLVHGLDWVMALRPVTFDYITTGSSSLGFIAEEVDLISPLLTVRDDQGILSTVRYELMPAVLTKAIQELKVAFDSILAWFDGDSFRVQGEICVDDVCISKDEFKNLLLENGGRAAEPEPEPEPTEPEPVDPGPVDPDLVDPDPIDPDPIDPGPVDPDPVDPNPVDPDPIDPGPVDPSPVDSNPVDSGTGGDDESGVPAVDGGEGASGDTGDTGDAGSEDAGSGDSSGGEPSGGEGSSDGTGDGSTS